MYPKQRKDTVRISPFRKMNLAGLWKDQLGGKTTSGKLYSYLRRNLELEWSWQELKRRDRCKKDFRVDFAYSRTLNVKEESSLNNQSYFESSSLRDQKKSGAFHRNGVKKQKVMNFLPSAEREFWKKDGCIYSVQFSRD